MVLLHIGLDAFEHVLLEEFISVFAPTVPEDMHPEDLYSTAGLWHWFAMVKGDYNLTFYDEKEALDVKSDHLKAWAVFLSRISGDRDHPCFGRHKTFLAQNPEFPRCLQEQDIGTEPICETWPADNAAWLLVTSLLEDTIYELADARNTPVLDFPASALELLFNSDEEVETADAHSNILNNPETPEHGIADPDQISHRQDDQSDKSDDVDDMTDSEIVDDHEPFYDIWSLLRTCASLRRNQQNRDKVAQFLRAGGFLDSHVPVSSTGQYVCKASLIRLSERCQIRLSQDSDGIYHLPPFLMSLLRPIRPLSMLEMIPNEDLELVSPQSSDLLTNTTKYVCWRTTAKCRFDHHLFTEEEVFRYCVTRGWTFPGHLENGCVIFRLTPLTQSDLLNDLTKFWENWNDIAITQDPDSKEWFVLETTPGLKFRALLEQNNRFAALEYFRTLANEANQGPTQSLQAALELNFQPRFENLLKIIPHEQIIHIDTTPMRGAHGAVFRAIWARPESIGVAEAEERVVALKTVAATNTRDQNRIFQELDLTFSATVGQKFGNIRFWGVVQTPPAVDRPITSVWHTLPSKTTFLMFDFAVHGSLSSHLRKSMNGTDSDWDQILLIVSAAVAGLENLHKAGMVHRDLHLENVLVTERETSSDGLVDTQLSIVLADFGEGKMVNLPNQTAAPSLRSAGNTYMRPPEIQKYDDYTAKSDIFDFGRMLEELVVLQWRSAEKKHGSGARKRLPLWLYNTIQQCLEIDPEIRPTSAVLSKQMDALEENEIGKRQTGPFDLIDPEDYNSQQQMETVLDDIEDEIPRG